MVTRPKTLAGAHRTSYTQSINVCMSPHFIYGHDKHNEVVYYCFEQKILIKSHYYTSHKLLSKFQSVTFLHDAMSQLTIDDNYQKNSCILAQIFLSWKTVQFNLNISVSCPSLLRAVTSMSSINYVHTTTASSITELSQSSCLETSAVVIQQVTSVFTSPSCQRR